jgi:glycosyltransferase involved in cell wall biosynthesis
MQNTKKKSTVALIFSHGIGLRTWYNLGLLEREVSYYREVAKLIGNVIFLTYDKKNPVEESGMPDLEPFKIVYNSTRLPYRLFGLAAPFLKYRSLRHVDVIKTNQFIGSWTGLLLKWTLRKPLLTRCGYVWSLNVKRSGASAVRNRITKFVEGFVLKHSDAIAVPDQYALNYISEIHGIFKDRLTILPNSVDTNLFAPVERSERSPSKFLFVGRLSSEKRPQLAVAAAALTPTVQLDVIGDGLVMDAVRLVAERAENINFLGICPHSEVSKMMSTARGLVITSRYEGSPKVVIESMSSGLPVIAVKSPGLMEIVEDGVNGLLVDSDPESIAIAMGKLVDDHELWREMSDNCRRIAVETYSRRSVINKEISLLARLIRNNQPAVLTDSE